MIFSIISTKTLSSATIFNIKHSKSSIVLSIMIDFHNIITYWY